MAYTILVHILNEEPFVGEIDDLPGPADVSLRIQNPRKRDGKDLPYLQGDVTSVLYPWSRINFIEVLPSGGEDEIIGFVRE
ncbi:MAG: hypothetical protein KIS80_02690 [Anaerolineales bacterium]|nr:hypothetical protein [Anaerolineales bacterium]MCW5855842.1 hypothetical protein [Anaerolineales bacterium]MCW5877760.1 hypothetical protein [Anaerolineales bacterium]